MPQTIEYSLKGSMEFLTIGFAIRVNHLDNTSLSHGCEESIEDKYPSEYEYHFHKILFVSEVYKCLKKLVLLLEYDHISVSDLVEEYEEEPEHPDKWREKIEFLQWMESCDELPCGEDDRFFHDLGRQE